MQHPGKAESPKLELLSRAILSLVSTNLPQPLPSKGSNRTQRRAILFDSWLVPGWRRKVRSIQIFEACFATLAAVRATRSACGKTQPDWCSYADERIYPNRVRLGRFVRSDHPFTKRSGDMVYTSVL